MLLSLYHDRPESESCFERFRGTSLLGGLKALDSRARRKGLAALDPARGALIPIGMRVDDGRVVENGLGVFSLAWDAEKHPAWADRIAAEVDAIREGIRRTHGVPLQSVIWAGAAEDKAMYQAAGLLRRGPRCYLLDSADAGKYQAIVEDLRARSHIEDAEMWKRTLVVCSAQAAAMSKMVDGRANLLCLPPDRRCSALSQAGLYALGLAGVDLRAWVGGACLSAEDVRSAWRLASFLDVQARAGRDKVTLLAPKAWAGIGGWTKREFEESSDHGIRMVTGEAVRMTNYRSPRDAGQDRVFLAVQMKGAEKLALVRRSGYPLASLSFPESAPLSRYMQWMHYAMFGLAWLRGISFAPARAAETRAVLKSGGEATWRGRVTLRWDRTRAPEGATAPAMYASLLKQGSFAYGELAYGGDTRYSAAGRAMKAVLDRAAEKVFRAGLKVPVDVSEGPAGSGNCFSTMVGCDGRAQGAAVWITLRDLEDASIRALDEFFRQAATQVRKRR